MNENEIALPMMSGRPQSPAVERAMQEQVITAFTELLAKKSLFQNVRINTDCLSSFTATNPEYSGTSLTLDNLTAEFSKRPWMPYSHGHGDEPQYRSIYRAASAGAGAKPLGTPPNEFTLPIALPDIGTWCSRCEKETTFSSLLLSGNPFGSPYPLLRDETEEVFVFYYKCALCRSQIIVSMVKRQGFTIQLCGRSERQYLPTPAVVEKRFRSIVGDAMSAAAENDTYAAFYHLRTFLEHYIKDRLAIAVPEQIRGDELCARYSKSLDPRMSSGLPSLGVIWQDLSKYMHTRTGEQADFERLLQDTYAHLEAKKLFERYAK